MEGKQTKKINVVPLKYKRGDPTKCIDDYQIFCNCGNGTEEARGVLIHC
jgi:hypothetical protein